jgi:hypothetical protein
MDVTVKYNIINISSKGEVYNASQVGGSDYQDKTFSANFKVGKGFFGNKAEMNVVVNVSIEYNLVDNINKVSNNENVLLIVDDVRREIADNYEPAGRGELPGQTAAVEFDHKGDKKMVQHEQGHNFGLEHVETPGNLMKPGINGTLNDAQKRSIFFGISGNKDGTYHIGSRNAKQEAKNFVNKRSLTYDDEKKKKAGF